MTSLFPTALAAFIVAAFTQPAAAPPLQMPQITAEPRCDDEGEPDPNRETIVVCGSRGQEDSPYRIPREFRNLRTDDDRAASRDARTRDEQILESYGSQNVGPFGYLQRSRQRDCEWRAARQEAQGRRPNCYSRVQPDSPTDWQRRAPVR